MMASSGDSSLSQSHSDEVWRKDYAMVSVDVHEILMSVFHAARVLVEERPNVYTASEDFRRRLDDLADEVGRF